MRKQHWPGIVAVIGFITANAAAQPPANPLQSFAARVAEQESEQEEEIETDRDSFTPATTLAAQGRLVVETAYTYLDNREVADTHSFPELLCRYGLNRWVELRLGWNDEFGGAENTASGETGDADEEFGGIEEVHRLSYGLKAALSEPEGWLPRTALIVQGFTPTGGDETATRLTTTFVGGWSLPSRAQFDFALRYSFAREVDDHFDLWEPSVVYKQSLGERWKAHVEYFGVFTSGKEQAAVPQYVSPGLHVLLTPRLEVGTRLGWGLNDDAARFFVNSGVGWLW